MLSNVMKVRPLGKGSRRPDRPYPKGDITIEDQQREQRKLLNAGKAFSGSGYSRLNLDIIAISYEHKCFSEAKNREEYIAKIRKKLIEWKYVPSKDEDEGAIGPLQLPPQPPGQTQKQLQSPKAVRAHHQRHRSGPPQHTVFEATRSTNGVSPGAPPRAAPTSANFPTSPIKSAFPRTGQFSPTTPTTSAFQTQLRPHIKQEAQSHDQLSQSHNGMQQQSTNPFSANANSSPNSQRHPSSPYSSHPSPQGESLQLTGSPKSQPMSHTVTTMSDSSSNSSSQDAFVDILNPKFLDTINLNDPEIRAMWITSVWEYFLNGGQWNGYTSNGSNAGSQSNSPVPMFNSIYPNNNNVDSNDVSMQGVQHSNGVNGSVDMIGSFGNFSNRVVNGNCRRQSEDLARLTNGRTGNGAINGQSQWMTSDYHNLPMDLGVGNMNNMDGIMSGDGLSPGKLPSRNYEKWMVQ
ncbi:hypothetical protein BDZ91DRAFT_271360 [Kalaharituber pfeilii]|nr:hypothetical protein BDZ91DRAFT_271360 [Kalaharituber pfeilii]